MLTALQIKKLTFKAGLKVGSPALSVAPENVTLLVGPNNSGKSRALREIEAWCWGDNAAGKVVGAVEIVKPADEAEAMSLLEIFKIDPPEGQAVQPNHCFIGAFTFGGRERQLQQQIPLQGFVQSLAEPTLQNIRHWLIRYYTARLDGRTRFALSDPQESGDLQLHARNHLWALFKNDMAREKVRAMTEEAFALHFVIDPTAMNQFRARMSSRKPATKAEEQGLDAAARKFHRESALITELGDGIQTFTGLVAAVMSLPHKILLIDEPEAFLHPPLARRLGANLSKIATERNASLVVSTHSADFVMGCLESNPATNVVRLTYENASATARALAPADLSSLMKDPLLRSTGALRGMFHRGVIVTEAEKDRAFYDEINRRLQEVDPKTGASDSLFINAQNWQTTQKIASPLRRLGIPAAIVLDIDTIADGAATNKTWTKFYEACAVPAADRTKLDAARLAIEPHVKAITRAAFKLNGVNGLAGAAKADVEAHLKDLASLGIFVVPVGEVECWLANLGVAAGKSDWLEEIFLKLGDNPTSATYVKPTNGDVWDFLGLIAAWINNPSRAGMP